MKHFSTITKNVPAAALVNEHPAGVPSLIGFLQDPIGVLNAHIQYILGFITSAFLGDKELSW